MKKVTKYRLGIAGAIIATISIAVLIGIEKIWQSKSILSKIIVDKNETNIQVKTILEKYLGMNMESVNLADIERDLEKYASVKNAIVNKQHPSKIRVTIKARAPIAYASHQSSIYLIYENGSYAKGAYSDRLLPFIENIITPLGNSKTIVSRKKTLELCKAIAESKQAKMILTQVHQGKKMYALAKNTNTKFIFGDKGNYEDKVSKFETFWKRVITIEGLDVFSYVDFRFQGEIFAKKNR